ncbi:HEPN/Toprim-associated domain-containing protein, partial [Rubrivirga litoralis]
MGSYSEIKLGALSLGSVKNGYDPYLLSLFQESDKRLVETTLGECGLYGEVDEGEENDPITLIQYACTVPVVRDRLELLGFTRSVAEKGFEVGRSAEVDRLEEWSRRDSYGDLYAETLSVLRQITLDQWQETVRDIEAESLHRANPYDRSASLSPLHRYVLTNNWYGFPGHEYRHFLRLAVDTVPSDTELVYDLTDLVLGGWVDDSDELVEELADEVS